MAVNKCKGFFCGSNIISGSITADRLDKESLVEAIKEILLEEANESWFKELFETVLKDSVDSDWLREFFKSLFEKYTGEEWFKELICAMGCLGEPEVFDVIPTDFTFEAEGGQQSMQIIVAEDAAWELTL